MRKPDPNSKRQRIIALNVGEEITFPRPTEKVGTINSILFSIKQDEGQTYSYRTTEDAIIVTRKS